MDDKWEDIERLRIEYLKRSDEYKQFCLYMRSEGVSIPPKDDIAVYTDYWISLVLKYKNDKNAIPLIYQTYGDIFIHSDEDLLKR